MCLMNVVPEQWMLLRRVLEPTNKWNAPTVTAARCKKAGGYNRPPGGGGNYELPQLRRTDGTRRFMASHPCLSAVPLSHNGAV